MFKRISILKDRAFTAKSVIQYLKSKKQLYPNKFINDWYKLIFEDNDILFMHARDKDAPNFNPKKIISDYLFQLKDAGVFIYAGNYFFKLPDTFGADGGLSVCKFCKQPLPLSAEYCGNCGVAR